MTVKSRLQLLVLAAVAIPFAQAGGGMYFSIGNPLAASDPAAHNAFVTARVFRCRGFVRADGAIQATAEGLVDGKRVSVTLQVVPLSIPGLYAIKWTQPKEGAWVLDLRSDDNVEVIIPVGPDGVRPRTMSVYDSPRPSQINMVLAKLAAGT